ncbi:MAG: Bsp6I family type II restriction endonuclease [Parcubacteria group bacterium]|nr:Bsp6I family type II restriction endonuclease [Parcubacteria group bacterium]
MKIKKHKTIVFGEKCELELMHFTKGDIIKLKKLFNAWAKLTVGMKEFRSRGVNIPEGISEVAFCIYTGSTRMLGLKGSASKSFDTFNLKTGKAEQIKACSVKGDLTSFGPKSKWDDLYFLDFYNDGNIDGTFDIYKIPNHLIQGASVNKGQKFSHQQAEKRRPRLRVKKEVIEKHQLKPLASNVKLWS